MEMEKILKALFDLQRFEEEPELGAVIDQAHGMGTIRELSLDDMVLAAAAGTKDISKPKDISKRLPDPSKKDEPRFFQG